MNSSPKKRTREAEIALIKQISTSLDAQHGAPDPQMVAQLEKEWRKPMKRKSTKSPANVLILKALVKGIAKACVQENLEINNEKSVGVVDSLIEEYRLRYPTLTKQKVSDALEKYKASDEYSPVKTGGGGGAKGEASSDENDEIKLGRCIEIVEEAVDEYHEKIESLKRKREIAAARPGAEEDAPGSYFQRRKVGKAPKKDPASPPKPRGRPPKNTPETALIKEITERYARERELLDRLPNGAFETIVEETKRDLNMEDVDLSLEKIRKRVTWVFMHRKDNGDGVERKKRQEVYEEVYRRYSRTKESNGGKLPPGTLRDLIVTVKLEHGVSDVKMTTLETKIRNRFKKENPGFMSNPPSALDSSTLSAEQKRNRRLLINEITKRYIRRKEEGSKKLPEGELDRIIEDTKDDLGIHNFEISKQTIRGRVERKSHSVNTLGKNSPYDAIDEPLVKTINTWLSQGVSVTRAQGLEFANALLKGSRTDESMNLDDEGNEVVLNAKWWRNFLDRNRKKLVCSND